MKAVDQLMKLSTTWFIRYHHWFCYHMLCYFILLLLLYCRCLLIHYTVLSPTPHDLAYFLSMNNWLFCSCIHDYCRFVCTAVVLNTGTRTIDIHGY